MKKSYKIINCPKCNFTHIDPIPSEKSVQKYYENKYLKSWFDFASRHPYNNVSNIVDNTIENPSKYDLFKLQLKLQLKDITHIGW